VLIDCSSGLIYQVIRWSALPLQLTLTPVLVAVSVEICQWYTAGLEKYFSEDKEKLEQVLYKNAFELFPRIENVMSK
jgi:hypothetical protein